MLRAAAAAYDLTPPARFDAYAAKMDAWVHSAADAGASLLVFPEYGAMELAALAGPEVAGTLEASLRAADEFYPQALDLWTGLASRYAVHILAPSSPVFANGHRPVNRAALVGPTGCLGHQDKQVMTCFERTEWHVVSGDPLRIFETPIGTLAVLICYDVEFPLLARALAEAGAEILLVPSCTDTPAGHARVRIGAMARALEGQCVVVHAATVGEARWCPAVDINIGQAAIYGPPDLGFPSTGVLAEGGMNQPGWTFAEIDLGAIDRVRRAGHVRNFDHWRESDARSRVDLP